VVARNETIDARKGLSVTRKPSGSSWQGFTPGEAALLDRLDFYGNNGWSRTPQLESLMPGLLAECEQAGLPLERVKDAMASVGYSKDALHQIDRWESKRTTGKFGP
jgi:hypothetical protein